MPPSPATSRSEPTATAAPDGARPRPVAWQRAPERSPAPPAAGAGDGLRTGARDRAQRRALLLADGAGALLAVALAAHLAGSALRWPVLLVPGVACVLGKVAGSYDHDAVALRRSSLDEVPGVAVVAAPLALLVWLLCPVLLDRELDRPGVAALAVLLVALPVAGRALARGIVRRTWPPERCMLVGGRSAWDRLALSMSMREGLELVEFFALRGRASGRFEPLGRALRNAEPRLARVIEQDAVDRVVIALSGPDEHDEDLLDGVLALEGLGVKVSVIPHMLEVIGSAGELEDFDGLPVLGVRTFGLGRGSRAVKRAMDVAVSGVLLLLSAPVLLATAAAVRRSSPGPVLYRQRRIGRDGQPFEMLKFRTMVDGAEELRDALRDENASSGVFKLPEDPRVTPLGRRLRQTSLDELPQLLNVLRGSMSLVGPRPLVPDEDAAVLGWRRRRLALSPGMTGPWQVLVSTRVPLDEMVKMDYLYIANWSPWSDVKALLQTLPHVLGRRGL